ncbi:hypothetical protein NBRC116597_18340 [Phaeobacter sp. NW0010-22]
MLGPDREIQNQNTDQHFDPVGPIDMIEQTPTIGLRIHCGANSEEGQGKGKAPQDHCVEDRYRQIGYPSLLTANRSWTARMHCLGDCEECKEAEENGQTDERFMFHAFRLAHVKPARKPEYDTNPLVRSDQ